MDKLNENTFGELVLCHLRKKKTVYSIYTNSLQLMSNVYYTFTQFLQIFKTIFYLTLIPITYKSSRLRLPNILKNLLINSQMFDTIEMFYIKLPTAINSNF